MPVYTYHACEDDRPEGKKLELTTGSWYPRQLPGPRMGRPPAGEEGRPQLVDQESDVTRFAKKPHPSRRPRGWKAAPE